MTLLVIVIVVLVLIMSPLLRCFLANLLKVLYYAPVDTFFYFAHKKYNDCITGVIVAINGLFGKGKTLTAVHIIVNMYMRMNNKRVWCSERKKFVTQKIKIISNVELLNVPYERFESLKQIIYAAENNHTIDMENDTKTITLVFGDEFSVQMNSRNFKTNIDPLFLNTILTCRHYHIALYYTAQRFGHVDALLRQVTSYCIECNKLWRFQGMDYFDAWQLENAASPKLVKAYKRKYWFIRNKDFERYNTLATVGNLAKSCESGDMITQEQILALQAGNMDAEQILKPSRKFKRARKR